MEAPKCKTCDERHWGLCPSIREAATTKTLKEPVASNKPELIGGFNVPHHVANAMVRLDVLTGDSVLTEDVLTGNSQACKKWRLGNKDSYNSYMRDYMRRKRHGVQGKEEG